MPELEGDQVLFLGLSRSAQKRLEHPRPRAPGDVKSRYGVTVAVGPIPAALGPPDDRKPAHPLLVQPRPCLTRGKGDKGFRPLPRPEVFLAVKAGRPHPVVERELLRVLHPQPTLFGSIDQEQAPKRPESLAAQALLRLLVDDDHPLAEVGQLGRGNQTGQAAPHDDHVGVIAQARLLIKACFGKSRTTASSNKPPNGVATYDCTDVPADALIAVTSVIRPQLTQATRIRPDRDPTVLHDARG